MGWRDSVRLVGWSLVGVALLAVGAWVVVKAVGAHDENQFNRWVGWSNILALVTGAVGTALLVFDKASQRQSATSDATNEDQPGVGAWAGTFRFFSRARVSAQNIYVHNVTSLAPASMTVQGPPVRPPDVVAMDPSRAERGLTTVDSPTTLGRAEEGIHRTTSSSPMPSVAARQYDPAELPPDISHFSGRRRELKSLRALTSAISKRRSTGPVVTVVHGKPGTGKSALVIRFAHQMRAHCEIQLYVDLKGAGNKPLDGTEALDVLVRGLGAGGVHLPMDSEELRAAYRNGIAGRRAIVVLDNAASESQVRPLLPESSTCLLLITSRHPLDELVCNQRIRLDVLSEEEAVSLIARVAGDRVRSREDRLAAAGIARRCNYLPLALSMAARDLCTDPDQSIAEIVSRFDERLTEVLVRVNFDNRYDQLKEIERRLLRRLCLLPEATFGASQAAALLAQTSEKASETLDRLVDEKVLRRVGDGQYAFHDLIGTIATTKLADEEESADRLAAGERALRLYLREAMSHSAILDPTILELDGTAAMPSVTLNEQLAALDWFERERQTLLLVSRRSANIGAHDVTWRLAASLVPFFELRGYWQNWTEVQDAALKAAKDDMRAEVWANLGAGSLYQLAKQRERARASLQEALESAGARKWPRLQARAYYLMGRLQQEEGHNEDALKRYRRAADIFHDQGMIREQATTILSVALVQHEKRELTGREALLLGDRVLEVLEEVSDDVWLTRMIGEIKRHLGRAAEELHDLERAGEYFKGSEHAFRKIRFRHGHGLLLRQMGQMRTKQQLWDAALGRMADSIAVFKEIGDRYEEGLSLLASGQAQIERGNVAEARTRLKDALEALLEVNGAEVKTVRALIANLPAAGGDG